MSTTEDTKPTLSQEQADEDQVEASPDIHFEPIIKLDEVEVKTNEEDEDVTFKMRAKLFRFTSGEWKERGTGDVRFLKHKETSKIRLVMRREQTHKVCANHYITSDMELKSNVGSERSWVYFVQADYSEQEPTPETLAVRFATVENALKFKEVFTEAQASNAALKSGSENPKDSEKTTESEPKASE